MDQNRLSFLALHFIPGIGDHLIRQLVSYCGSAEQVFKTPKGKLLKIPGIGEVTAESIKQGKPFSTAEQELKKAEKENVQIVFFTDKNYPSRLKQINDSPSVLYLKGNMDFENPKTIGIVGTRQATDYGRERVEELVEGLVAHQALVVSGLAYGIDIHAHKHAVKVGLPTIGVMGSGIDVVYPSSHKEIAKKMMDNGGLVTEHSFGTQPDAHHFPARNRIVAGLSDAIIIVEAAQKGGALITADIANSYNKDVFAYPGNVGQSHSEGCNNLIKSNRANLITSVKDLEYVMNWDAAVKPEKKPEVFLLDNYSPNEQLVLKTLLANNKQLVIDELSWKTNVQVSQLASILLELEFKGIVKSLPGKVYKLVKA
ncbi:DNA-processing protein DprA [Chryseosolibacter indicus]|uniref:DNA-processing protein DprA n=1 Tax=Chryseosolibacter indicus TaxID=2782351 RepID=A0ABS5VWT9_9BACT|nr:DNA-processing protein DprA [Chryseosolibacter indicus]MBT1705199.1 DNA-processing protein DprA [Chryseosolibacter indicus]